MKFFNCITIIFICLMTVVCLPSVSDEPYNADMTVEALSAEAAVSVAEGNKFQAAIWLPYEYMLPAMNYDEASAADIQKQMQPYLVISVRCCTQKEDGNLAIASEEEIRLRASLKAPDGSDIMPLTNLSPWATKAVDAIKKKVDGSGVGLQILVFPSTTKEGKPLVNVSGRSRLELVLKSNKEYKEASFVWHTPFDTAITGQPCTKCGGQLSAKWFFCPWCGMKQTDN